MEASLVDLMSTVNLDQLENPHQRSGLSNITCQSELVQLAFFLICNRD